MTAHTAEAYLARIGYDSAPRVDIETLAALQRAHLSSVPFENLHVFHQIGVRTDTDWSLDKIVSQRRGGWCFEANGAFAWLLESLGFEVRRLGAAVLLEGPNKIVDHLTLEVMLDEPWLVDVGFGDSFIEPLALNRTGAQDGGSGTYEFMGSPQGTTLTQHVDGLPAARFRFKRTTHVMADFDPASDRLQANADAHWRRLPFATRLLDDGPDRVTLLADRLKIRRNGQTIETPVAQRDWGSALIDWFDMTVPAQDS